MKHTKNETRVSVTTHREARPIARTGKVYIGKLGGDAETRARPSTLSAAEVRTYAALADSNERHANEAAFRARQAELSKPLRMPADPATPCEVLTPIRVQVPGADQARAAAAGERVTLPRSLAADLAKIGRVRIL